MSVRIRRGRRKPVVLNQQELNLEDPVVSQSEGHGKTNSRSTKTSKSSENAQAAKASGSGKRGTTAGKTTTRKATSRKTAPDKAKAGKTGKSAKSSRTRKADKSGKSSRTSKAGAPKKRGSPTDPVVPARKKLPKSKVPRARETAESMAGKQRQISVSEFFTKNRHLLGFDSPARALLTTVKEAVDNSLDAAEEAGILPKIHVELREISDDRFRVIVEDNGPGIVKGQVPKVFGTLLYGSKFHRLRQSRGQQGIGISAAGMYGQLTTGKPVVIRSKTHRSKPAHQFEIVIDTAKNKPVINKDETMEWDTDHGTRIEIELQGTYKAGRRSVDEYLEQVAIANPHAEISYQPPKGKPPVHLPRAASELPDEPEEIKPHPYGVELGALQRLLKDSKSRTLSAALQSEFSRVSSKVAEKIADLAGLSARKNPRSLKPGEIERLHQVIPKVKIYSPPSSCVVPIGEDLVRKGLEREIQADFYASSTRPPAVYRGNPFQVEVGLAYGGELRRTGGVEDHLTSGKEVDAQAGPITLLRLANRVPLQYQQSACATFKAVVETNWRQYGLAHPRGALPQGPMVLLVHIASVWVPFTSESKEAVAHYQEILKELKLGLQECGRKLGTFLRKREHAKREERRRGIFEMYIGEIVESLGNLTRINRQKLQKQLRTLADTHTGGDDANVQAAIKATRKVKKRAKES